ncbi:MAG: ribose 5-phosphate isomerase B [Spirochaetes bacterium]|nr:MAG: ribose 5-phosphate isomerase B [Spirochaetota bacterium]
MTTKPELAIGCDHAGFEIKEKLKKYLIKNGHKVKDLVPDYRDEISYTETALATCRYVLENKDSFGILICGTGIGMSIAANRIKGIRAALLYSDFVAEYSRKHNDANVLVFGARTMNIDEIISRINIFFAYNFLGGKYKKRNEPLDNLSNKL